MNATGVVYWPNLHCGHLSILEVVVRFKTLPLDQLLLCDMRPMQDAPNNSKCCAGTQQVTEDSSVLKFAIVPHRERIICLLRS